MGKTYQIVGTCKNGDRDDPVLAGYESRSALARDFSIAAYGSLEIFKPQRALAFAILLKGDSLLLNGVDFKIEDGSHVDS